ncbi:hypothetical protein CHS0354_028833, partial [Potamilus streckersoni]
PFGHKSCTLPNESSVFRPQVMNTTKRNLSLSVTSHAHYQLMRRGSDSFRTHKDSMIEVYGTYWT